MDVLMAAFVAGLLLAAGDRTSWLAAILAERSGRPAAVIAGATLALAAGNTLAAIGAVLIAPRLTPNAQDLMLALALGLAGVGGLFGGKRPDALGGWRTPVLLTSLFGIFILAFGEGMQFVTLALAARTPVPAFAAVGATLGTLAVVVPAALAGETAYAALPLRAARIAVGTVLLVTAAVLALGALRLT